MWNKIKYYLYIFEINIIENISIFYLFIRLLIIIGEYIFILKTNLF